MLENLWNYLTNLMKQNEFLQGGFVLGVLAAGFRYCYALPRTIWNFILNYLIFSVEFDKQDPLFQHFIDWIDSINIAERKRRLRVTTRAVDPHECEQEQIYEPVYSLAPGTFFIRHQFWMKITRGKTMSAGDEMEEDIFKALNMERFEVETMIWNRKKLLQWIKDVYQISNQKAVNFISIKKYEYSWYLYKRQPKTKLENVILKEGQKEEILQDIENFTQSQQWYKERDIPFRRGYLLSGPPGTGKTSLIVALASHLGYNINMIDLTGYTNTKLMDSLANIEKNSLTIIEDIDSFFEGQKCLLEGKADLTFSGLLNAIDGVVSSNGRILFITTNHEEKIDPALKRNGRIDQKIVLDYLDDYQYKMMFLKFFPDQQELLPLFMERYARNRKMTPCKMQQIFTTCRENPKRLLTEPLSPDEEYLPTEEAVFHFKRVSS